jgi:hypothetical protein
MKCEACEQEAYFNSPDRTAEDFEAANPPVLYHTCFQRKTGSEICGATSSRISEFFFRTKELSFDDLIAMASAQQIIIACGDICRAEERLRSLTK